ncbi:hypothetical protein KJ636_01735, partial [Patescibacteria group bacterium]|nr:hypothetical protein [Patescibacteria group bacterium]
LVLIAQIPLLLKLYFDYREKKIAKQNTFREQIFQKQVEGLVEVYKTISRAETKLIDNSILFLEYLEIDMEEKKKQKLFDKLDGLYPKGTGRDIAYNIIECKRKIERYEPFLSSYLVVALHKYIVDSMRLTSVFVYKNKYYWNEDKHFEGKIDPQLFRKQLKDLQASFDGIINTIRLMIGVDSLSEDNLKIIYQEDLKKKVISLHSITTSIKD